MKYIVANWKMKMTAEEVLKWLKKWQVLTKDEIFENKTIIVCPSYVHIPLVTNHLENDKLGITVGAQDVSVYPKGSHTGDTGAFQLREFVTYSIIGHSERAETTDLVLQKKSSCKENCIRPITCFVGVESAIKYQEENDILAWEDPANISVNGIYKDKEPEEINKGIEQIREKIDSSIVLLYGGSVNRQNIHNLVNIERLDGVLIGNASLEPEHFLDIVKAYK